MNTYKKEIVVPSLILDKEKLFEIEKELKKPWEELRRSLVDKITEKTKKQNKEIGKKGYSFVFGTEDKSSKSKINKKQLEKLISNEKILNEELEYPQKTPKITFHNRGKQIEVSSVNELYEHTLDFRFDKLEFTVYGPESKVIILSFSSHTNLLNSISSSNTLTVSSSNEAWTALTSDRILSIVKKFESNREVFNNWLVKFFFHLILPIGTVYLCDRLLSRVNSYANLPSGFSLFLSILFYFFVFFFSMFYVYNKLFEQLVQGTVLQDQVPEKLKFWSAASWAFALSVASTIVWEIIKTVTQIL